MSKLSKVFYGLLGIALLASMICVYKINQINQVHKQEHPDYDWPNNTDFLYTIAFAFVLHLISKVFTQNLQPHFYKLLKAKYQGQQREERAFRGSLHVFKFFYYTSSTIILYNQLD